MRTSALLNNALHKEVANTCLCNMEQGVAASYDTLAELLASLGAQGMQKGAGES